MWKNVDSKMKNMFRFFWKSQEIKLNFYFWSQFESSRFPSREVTPSLQTTEKLPDRVSEQKNFQNNFRTFFQNNSWNNNLLNGQIFLRIFQHLIYIDLFTGAIWVNFLTRETNQAGSLD